MTNKQFGVFVCFILCIVVLFLGLKIASKRELCDVYYKELNTLTCFLSDSTLPQRTNR